MGAAKDIALLSLDGLAATLHAGATAAGLTEAPFVPAGMLYKQINSSINQNGFGRTLIDAVPGSQLAQALARGDNAGYISGLTQGGVNLGLVATIGYGVSMDSAIAANSEVAATGNTIVTRTVGQNTANYVVDAQGNTLSVSGTLSQDFGGGVRSSAEVQAQADAAAAGVAGDQGHLVDYRFLPEQGSINLFPQQGNFNISAFKTLENDYARYINQGYSVDFEHTLGNLDPITGRPGSLTVDFNVSDINGNTVDSFSQRFNNTSGQTYTRRAP